LNSRPRNISILGSTGIIGVHTLDLVEKYSDQFNVIGLSAGKNVELLFEQIKKSKPKIVSLQDETAYKELKEKLNSLSNKPEVLFNEEGAIEIATQGENDIVISAIVGAAALVPTLAAIKTGKRIGLANKESLVIAGELMMAEAKQSGAELIPIDSEHSAIFQCLSHVPNSPNSIENLNKVKLTASGGPFWNYTAKDLQNITIEQALNHPRWKMGPKITIDSATLMNKGLELIEACHLFSLNPDRIDILVHPQSIVHSLVEFKDGVLLAHLGVADMKAPISYALFYPQRATAPTDFLDLVTSGSLEFFHPDYDRFPALKLALEVAKMGGAAPAILNAANEVAVGGFLQGQVEFIEIPQIVEGVLDRSERESFKSQDCESLLSIDHWARQIAREMINEI